MQGVNKSFLIVLIFIGIFSPLLAYNYRLRYQPEIDAVGLDAYFKNERLYKSQAPCIINNGNCDTIGRWLKPRLPKLLTGQCQLCTSKQTKDTQSGIEYLKTEHPELLHELQESLNQNPKKALR